MTAIGTEAPRMPAQKPGRSRQDYGTPMALIRAIETRFGPLTIDLAATAENAKAPQFITGGSLVFNWVQLVGNGIGWLNPPFARITPWAKKCHDTTCYEPTSIIMLTPASVGSEWFANYIEEFAAVIALRPRLTFEGCTDCYPKDCMLSVFGPIGDKLPRFSTWRWDE